MFLNLFSSTFIDRRGQLSWDYQLTSSKTLKTKEIYKLSMIPFMIDCTEDLVSSLNLKLWRISLVETAEVKICPLNKLNLTVWESWSTLGLKKTLCSSNVSKISSLFLTTPTFNNNNRNTHVKSYSSLNPNTPSDRPSSNVETMNTVELKMNPTSNRLSKRHLRLNNLTTTTTAGITMAIVAVTAATVTTNVTIITITIIISIDDDFIISFVTD